MPLAGPASSPSSDDPKPSSSKQFGVGEVIWGPHSGFPSWPGKLMKRSPSGNKAKVCWFGTKEVGEVDTLNLKNLSDGLEAHHRERKKLRK